MLLAPLMLLLPLWLTVPPLTPAQQAQLATAKDGAAVLDEGALYPLLDNALAWTPSDESMAMVPDLQALLAEPAAYRGQLFLIEGRFAGRPRIEGAGRTEPQRFGPLARPGTWSGKMQEWVVVVDEGDPRSDTDDQVAVVYLVNPPSELSKHPAPGAKVRMPARFFKVWADTDRRGQARLYLTFVGHSATVTASQGAAGGLSGPTALGPMILVLLVAAVGFALLRARRAAVANRPLRARQFREQQEARRQAQGGDEPPALPDDPADALATLATDDRPPTNPGNPPPA